MKIKLLISFIFLFNTLFADEAVIPQEQIIAKTINLNAGWNLVGINDELTLDELKNKLGEDNLLVIQGPEKVYKKEYLADLNDFEKFEIGKGYWLKVSNASTLTYTPHVQSEPKFVVSLKQGWNLISAPESLSLTSALSQIGQDNLLVVQGKHKTYQKSYSDQGYNNLNDFENFELDSGYWIKVNNAINLEFSFNVTSYAVDNSNQTINSNIEIDGENYKLQVLTNGNVSDPSSNTIALIGKINDVSTDAKLKLNASYETGTSFQVKVFDSLNNEVAASDIVKYTTSPISFGEITFEIKNPNEKDYTSNYQGLTVFAKQLNTSDYNLDTISDADFNSLSKDKQYIIANKLLSTLYYGMPKNELDELIDGGKFISTIQTKLMTSNDDLVSVEEELNNIQYNWSKTNANRERILARLFKLDLGKDYLKRWAAYILTQSIMFSPAVELDTVSASDISNVYNRLVLYMDDEYSMQMITYLHMISDDNWKRFRSPEDNAREMLEIFLFDFEDAHVPIGGITLKNWSLDLSDEELIIGLNENTIPQNLFGTTITSGYDFYRELIKSSDFLKSVAMRLVNIYFVNHTYNEKTEIVNSIISSNPKTFEDILLQIIFSKEFLYNANRTKTVEESVFNLAKRMDFFDGLNFFAYLRAAMDNMQQSPLKNKLGRYIIVPTDTLSFAYYHDFVRRHILIDRKDNILNEWDSGWQQSFIDKSYANTDTLSGYIDYLFQAVISRAPTAQEKETLIDYIENKSRGYSDISTYNNRTAVAMVVMEYISRLSEVYTLKTIEE